MFQSGGNTCENMHGSIEKWFNWLKCDGVGFEGSIATTYIQQFKYNSNQTDLLFNQSLNYSEQERPWSDDFVNKLTKIFDDVESGHTISKEKMNENNVGICDWEFNIDDHIDGLSLSKIIFMFLFL